MFLLVENIEYDTYNDMSIKQEAFEPTAKLRIRFGYFET